MSMVQGFTALTGTLMQDTRMLQTSSTLCNEGVMCRSTLILCMMGREEIMSDMMRLQRCRILECSLRDPPGKLPTHDLSEAEFGEELAWRVAKKLCQGACLPTLPWDHPILNPDERQRLAITGRLILSCRMGLNITQHQTPWEIFREDVEYGYFVWRHSSTLDWVARWATAEDFVHFWARQTERSVAAYAAQVVFRRMCSSAEWAVATVTGTLKRSDMEQLANVIIRTQ